MLQNLHVKHITLHYISYSLDIVNIYRSIKYATAYSLYHIVIQNCIIYNIYFYLTSNYT